MSLQTDRVFFDALKANTTFMAAISNRLYNTAIPLPDNKAANVPAPYVIISFDGFSNDESTKDSYEGATDNVSVGIMIVAATREKLAELVDAIRTTIESYMENVEDTDPDFSEIPVDYHLSGSQISYDPDKNARYIQLTYACSVKK
jgi:hypothetical protein